MVCSTSEKQCERHCNYLGKDGIGGHNVSRKKLLFCQQQVEYFGRVISKEVKAIAQDQIEAIIEVPKPQTVEQMMMILGMAGYSSD